MRRFTVWLCRPLRRTAALGTTTAVLSVMLATALPASATSLGLSPDGCMAFPQGGPPASVGTGCATAGGGLDSDVHALAFSPDGADLYVGNDTSDLPFFTRATAGALSPAGCVEDVASEQNGLGTGSCGSAASTQGNGLYEDVPGVVVSPNGADVYALGLGGGQGGTVASFARRAGGRLSYLGCVEDSSQLAEEEGNQITPECGSTAATVTPGLALPTGIAISPDGRSVYVTAGNDVAMFKRAVNGALAPAGCIADQYQPISSSGSTSCAATAPGLDMASDVVVSPDGRNVYVTAESSSTVDVFRRSSSGALSAVGCLETPSNSNANLNCAQKVPGLLVGPVKLAIAPSGRTLYVVSDDSLLTLTRSATGALKSDGCIAAFIGKAPREQGCTAGPPENFIGLTSIALSPAGTDVYVGSGGYQAVFVLAAGSTAPPRYQGCIESASGGPGGPWRGPEPSSATSGSFHRSLCLPTVGNST